MPKIKHFLVDSDYLFKMGRPRKSSNSASADEAAEADLTRLLNESGKKDELRDTLMDHLANSGWRDQVNIKKRLPTSHAHF